MTVDEIRELIKLANESGIAELEVQRGENRVRIRRSAFTTPQDIVLAPPSYPAAVSAGVPAAIPTAPTPPASPTPPPIPGVEAKSDKPADPTLVLVKSPIVGTFYESPSPGAPPFVRM